MRKLVPLTLFVALFGLSLRAEKHALLIGIGAYNPSSGIPVLDGPPFDVMALRDLLTTKMGFTDVRTLVDAQATRAAILAQLNQLAARVKAGDYVVFYYSGHGTSFGDPASHTWGLDPNTGALLPWDLRLDGAQVGAQLIVGKRDLRPVFTQLDRIATVFAIFDTCYSADAAKSAGNGHGSRYVSPAALAPASKPAGGAGKSDLDADAESAMAKPDPSPYPYQRVISLAAAGKFQTAGDITRQQVTRDPGATLDHKPHGVLTNALLRGMNGEADKNHDGRVTHDELFNYLQESAVHWSHTPLMQAASGAAGLLASPAFGTEVTASDTAPAGQRSIFVKVEGAGPDLISKIKRLPRVMIAPDGANFDLLVRGAGSDFDLFDSTDVAISEASLSEGALLARIGAQPQVRDLIDLVYPQQFNVALRMKPADQSLWFAGQEFQFSARTDRAAYLLLLNIDITGVVAVAYPYGGDPGGIEAPGVYHALGEPDPVSEPYGVEYMKLFAFAEKPADYEHWHAPAGEPARLIEPGTAEFERLMRMLQSGLEGRAETRLRVVTAPHR